MKRNFLETAEEILQFKLHKDIVIRNFVITAIPTLAQTDTRMFTQHFLHRAMVHLLQQLEDTKASHCGRLFM